MRYAPTKQVPLFDDLVIRERAAKRPREYVTPVFRVSLIREAEFTSSWDTITSPRDAIDYFVRYFHGRGEDREVFVAVSLDVKKKPIHLERVSVGTLDAASVHPREVFKSAIVAGASAVLLAHNHPSGDPTPSRADILVTGRLKQAGDLLGIEVLDHIVVGHSRGVSIEQSQL